MQKRNCFISYHHKYDSDFVKELSNYRQGCIISDYSLKEDISMYTEDTIYKKIREKMRKCSVTVVLIGQHTGHRKWVDWEIWASLRAYRKNDNTRSFPCKGLMGILLPAKSHSIPPRLQDNVNSGYAPLIRWEDLNSKFTYSIETAINNRENKQELITNKREPAKRDYYNIFGLKI